MAWWCQAPSHHLSQCWPRSMSPYCVTRPQWVKALTSRTNGAGIVNACPQWTIIQVGTVTKRANPGPIRSLRTVEWILALVRLAACCIRAIVTRGANGACSGQWWAISTRRAIIGQCCAVRASQGLFAGQTHRVGSVIRTVVPFTTQRTLIGCARAGKWSHLTSRTEVRLTCLCTVMTHRTRVHTVVS